MPAHKPLTRSAKLRSTAAIIALTWVGVASCSTGDDASPSATPDPVADAADADAAETAATEPDRDGDATADAAADDADAEPTPRAIETVDESASVLAVIAEHPDLTTFATLVDAYGQEQVFTQARGVTLVVPDDEAFASLGADRVEQLSTDRDAFTLFLSDHMSIGGLALDELVGGGGFTNAMARSFPVSDDGTTVTIGDASIVEADLVAENGVIHIVDRPLAVS